MSRRRCVTVLALAASAAVWTAPAAGAATKTVLAGGPPPKASQAGRLRFPAALDLNGFFRRRVTIHVGDSVRWVFSQRVVHTVTFLAPGTPVPTLEQQDPAHPYTGVKDAAGNDFWFNGQPSLLIPPDHAAPVGGPTTDGRTYHNSGLAAHPYTGFKDVAGDDFWYDGKAPSLLIPLDHAGPVGGATTDGRTYHNSGLSAPAFKPYKLRFTRAGTFHYVCLVHPGMTGTVRVLAPGHRVPSARANRRAAVREMRRAVREARKLARFHPRGNRVVAAHDRGVVSWFRFFPATRRIKVGQSVRFSISSRSEIHTIAFGPESYRDNLEKNLIQGGPVGPVFNPQIFLPSDRPPLPPYDGTSHGNGFLNTGILDTNPSTPVPRTSTVRFTKAGTYIFECTIHPGMEGTIKVS
jgi:plastocyanin